MSQPVRPKTLLRAVNDTLRVHAASAILAFLFILFLPSWIRWFWFTACGLLLMVSILANFVEDWRPKSRVPVSGKAVVISDKPSKYKQVQDFHSTGRVSRLTDTETRSVVRKIKANPAASTIKRS
ncbi:hypothetical protein NPIL_84111 [Nephila pilipes]|uniref:Uncharacterized protein n=1 Tax=Nephila pilipes TaxID=299642 RepID=A0A8X6MXD8_NEPPI|nr:hypothetical protein NPIL_84111 [Nephila pilipes]